MDDQRSTKRPAPSIESPYSHALWASSDEDQTPSHDATILPPSRSKRTSPLEATASLLNPSEQAKISELLCDLEQPIGIYQDDDRLEVRAIRDLANGSSSNLRGMVPACTPESLGDRSFCRDHGLQYAYVSGAMATGIGSEEIAIEMAKAGMLGFFGSAGLSPQRVESAIDKITDAIPNRPFGCNLIHSPNEPDLEEHIVDLYLRRNVRLVEASAFMDLTLPAVKYRLHGIHRDRSGNIVTPNKIVAKVSRVEVGTRFLSPPPARLVGELIKRGDITADQAELAQFVPMAQDVTAEADSGGHTDRRPAVALIPTIIALANRLQEQYQFKQKLRVGAAGGIGTPHAASAAYCMGAAYVLVGSINQGCVESGTSDLVRQMLAEAGQADVEMAPAADMFEMGVKVQVLKRGTMFAMRSAKLYEIYRNCASMDEISPADRTSLEKTFFQTSLDEIWRQTREYFLIRDASQVERAEKDPKHKMALVFRWYLGHGSRWAITGEPSRRVDYQVWCGPAMGAFNEWVKNSVLEKPAQRKVVTVARNMLYWSAVLWRAHCMKVQGVDPPPELMALAPKLDPDLQKWFPA